MRKNILTIAMTALTLLAAPHIAAQEDSYTRLKNFAAHIAGFNRNCPQEKVFLHFDNKAYYLGETIWFSAYVVDASTLLPIAKSKVLYVELLTPDGDIMSHWGMRDFENVPNKERVLTLIANLTAFYQKEAKPYLYAGRMVPAHPVVCGTRSFAMEFVSKIHTFPRILSTAWQDESGKCVQILVNPEDEATPCTIDGREVVVPPLSAVMVEI